MDTEQSPGISRRDLIARSVVAGGLVWAAPALVSAPAAAQQACPCNNGVLLAAKIPSGPPSAINCGVQCLSQRAGFNIPCLEDLAECLAELGFIVVTEEFEHGQLRRATVVLKGGIQAISASIKSTNDCYYADCPDYTNTCLTATGAPNPNCDLDPPRITVALNTPNPGEVTVNFEGHGQPINPAELTLCVPGELTALC